jgi:hypothetical protein
MRSHRTHRGAADTSTVVIVIIVAVVVGLLVIGCVFAGLIGLMLPALGKAREAAIGARSVSQLLQIEATYLSWRSHAEPDAPFTFDVLVDEDFATPELFQSYFGPAPDGRGDFWLLHPRPAEDHPRLADIIVAYDRAMYATHGRVAVVFGDGRADVLLIEHFTELTGKPPNDTTQIDLPPRR